MKQVIVMNMRFVKEDQIALQIQQMEEEVDV